MKKLTTLFAIATLSTTLGLAGCKKKRDEEAKDNTPPAAAPVEPAAGSGQKTGDMKADDKAAPKPDDKAAAGALPTECNDYKAAIEKLAACDKMPKEARDSLKAAFDQASASWATLPPESKAGLSTSCKAGADAVMQSGKTTCGW